MKLCKECLHYNNFANTYIENNGCFDCCAYWHIAYHKWERKGDKPCCEKYKSKKIQLTLF